MMVKQTAACCIQVASLSYEGFFLESHTVRSVSAPACSMGLSLPVQNSDNRQLGGGGGGRGPISYLPATYTKLYPPNGRGGVGFWGSEVRLECFFFPTPLLPPWLGRLKSLKDEFSPMLYI